jgi:hypothetical protein
MGMACCSEPTGNSLEAGGYSPCSAWAACGFDIDYRHAISYRIKGVAQHEPWLERRAKSTRRPSPLKGIILAIAAGVLLGGFVPLMEKSRQGDLGLGPYAAGFLFAFGVFFSTFVYEIFFVNLPVEGEPVELGAYLSGRTGQHVAGLASGFIWYAGTIMAWVCASVPESMQVQPTWFLLSRAPFWRQCGASWSSVSSGTEICA